MLHEDHCRKPQHDMLKDYGSKEPTVGIETMSRRKRYISRVLILTSIMRDGRVYKLFNRRFESARGVFDKGRDGTTE